MPLPKRFFYLFFLLFFIKIVLAYILPAFADEAYYWVWGQHLQLSYFDHPGFVAWLTYLGNSLSFLPVTLSLRLPFIILSQLTLFVWIKIAVVNYSLTPKQITNYFLLFCLNPMLGFGGLLATPDVPLLFFWSLSYFTVLKILKQQRVRDYILLGVFLGLGFCSKYHIVLFPLTFLVPLFLFKLYSKIDYRKLWLTVFFGLIFSLPVLIWNFQNNWISFSFQLKHGLNHSGGVNLKWSLVYLVSTLCLINPIVFFSSIKRPVDLKSFSMAVAQYLFFLWSSLKAPVEANWPIAAHMQITSCAQPEGQWLKWAYRYWFIVWISVIIFLLSPLGTNRLAVFPQSKQAELIWQQVKDYTPIYGPTYQLSSLISFVSNKEINKLPGLSRFDFYDTNVFTKPTEKTFYVLSFPTYTWPEWLHNAKITPIKQLNFDTLTLYQVVL